MSSPLPHVSGSATSADAAEVALPKSHRDRALILAILQGCGTRGATDQELQDICAMDPSSERPRRVELVASGIVVDSGETRATKSGRRAVVWITRVAARGQLRLGGML